MKDPSINGSIDARVALITGGSRGIGKAVAVALSRLGMQVVVSYTTNVDSANSLVRELGEDKCLAVRSDASKMEDIEHLVATVTERFGRIDVLIANAGISIFMDLEEITENHFDKAFNLNVKGPFFLVQKAAPHMPARSSVILVSSSMCNTSQAPPDRLLYCSTKGAIEQMARMLAKSLGPRGIAVNALAPGATETESFYNGKSEHVVKTIAGFSPYNRIGTAEEVARAFVYLSESSNQWMTGQTICINGGSA